MSQVAVGSALHDRLIGADRDVATEVRAEHAKAMTAKETGDDDDDEAREEEQLAMRPYRQAWRHEGDEDSEKDDDLLTHHQRSVRPIAQRRIFAALRAPGGSHDSRLGPVRPDQHDEKDRAEWPGKRNRSQHVLTVLAVAA